MNGRKPTYAEKKLLIANKKNPSDWLLIKSKADTLEFKHRETDEKLILQKTN